MGFGKGGVHMPLILSPGPSLPSKEMSLDASSLALLWVSAADYQVTRTHSQSSYLGYTPGWLGMTHFSLHWLCGYFRDLVVTSIQSLWPRESILQLLATGSFWPCNKRTANTFNRFLCPFGDGGGGWGGVPRPQGIDRDSRHHHRPFLRKHTMPPMVMQPPQVGVGLLMTHCHPRVANRAQGPRATALAFPPNASKLFLIHTLYQPSRSSDPERGRGPFFPPCPLSLPLIPKPPDQKALTLLPCLSVQSTPTHHIPPSSLSYSSRCFYPSSCLGKGISWSSLSRENSSPSQGKWPRLLEKEKHFCLQNSIPRYRRYGCLKNITPAPSLVNRLCQMHALQFETGNVLLKKIAFTNMLF